MLLNIQKKESNENRKDEAKEGGIRREKGTWCGVSGRASGIILWLRINERKEVIRTWRKAFIRRNRKSNY